MFGYLTCHADVAHLLLLHCLGMLEICRLNQTLHVLLLYNKDM
jgi:hypothetical protein